MVRLQAQPSFPPPAHACRRGPLVPRRHTAASLAYGSIRPTVPEDGIFGAADGVATCLWIALLDHGSRRLIKTGIEPRVRFYQARRIPSLVIVGDTSISTTYVAAPGRGNSPPSCTGLYVDACASPLSRLRAWTLVPVTDLPFRRGRCCIFQAPEPHRVILCTGCNVTWNCSPMRRRLAIGLTSSASVGLIGRKQREATCFLIFWRALSCEAARNSPSIPACASGCAG
jgi:hypothetical protein